MYIKTVSDNSNSITTSAIPSKCSLCRSRYGIHTFVHFWSDYDLDLWPLTLKTVSAMPTHMTNICIKFYRNPFT